MISSEVAVVIPIYKRTSEYSKNENSLFDQAKKVFKNRNIFLAGPNSIKENYQSDQYFKFISFCNTYFKDKFTYSKLLCKKEFYQSFSDYKFIQIVQPDCWAFEDRLNEFMSLDFDYIGAPWMKDGFSGNPKPQLWKVGNGGFSLRKTSSFLSIIEQIHKSEKGGIPVFKDLGNRLTKGFKNYGFRNNLRHYIKHPPGEDIFWTHYVPKVFGENEFRVSDPITGAHYAFEVLPKFLLQEVTKGKLPMGCHGWESHDPLFWYNHIRPKL